jgi:hypothetical protein
MLLVGWVGAATLGDPKAPASAVKPLSLDIQLPVFPGQFDDGQAEARAQSARATADAIKDYKSRATEQARVSTEEARMDMTRESARIIFEATERAQSTQSAYFMRIAEWTKEADSVRSTSEARIQATASQSAATASARVEELQYQKDAVIATATADALLYEQEKHQLDLRQKAITNEVWAITGWVITVSLVALLVFFGYRFVWKKTEYTVIGPAANGDKQLILHRGSLIDPDLLTNPVTKIKAPAPIPLENQLQVKANDQRLDTARALPRIMPQVGLPLAAGFEVVGEQAAPPDHLLPNPEVMGVIDGEWNAQ